MKLKTASDWIAAILLSLTGCSALAAWQHARLADQRLVHLAAARSAGSAAAELERETAKWSEAARTYAFTGDPRARSAVDQAQREKGGVERGLAALLATAQQPGEAAAGVGGVDAKLLEATQQRVVALRQLHGRAVGFVAQGDRTSALALLYSAEYQTILGELRAKIGYVQAAVQQRAEASAKELARQARLIQQLEGALLAANAVLVAAALVGFYRRRVITPLARLTTRLQQQQAGDGAVAWDVGHGDNEITHIAKMLQRHGDTERQLEEQRRGVASTENWYRHIIESTPDGMLVVDAAGQILLANPELHRIFGYGPGQLIGSNIDALVPGSVRQRHVGNRERFMQASAGRVERLRGTFMAEHRSGEVFSVELSLSKMPAADSYGPCVCVALRRLADRAEPAAAARDDAASPPA